MRILGVDPGSVNTGYGVIDHIRGTLSLVDQGSISTRRSDALSTRLRAIYDGISQLIVTTRPEVIAVESPFHGVNVKSLVQLAHARGVVLLAGVNAGLPMYEYSPRTVKSAVVGYGAAEKHQVEHMVRLLIGGMNGCKLAADAADALAIAICHAHTVRPTSSRTTRAARWSD